jgi:Mrp family chromosome partitioning ATPase/capsular polysaccharide biosynthesis protein
MNETTDASAILAPLWRFKWLILLVGLIVAAATYEYYNGKKTTYQSNTAINLASGAEEQGIAPAEPAKKRGKKSTSLSASEAAATTINSPVVHGQTFNRLRSLNTPTAQEALRGAVNARGAANGQIVTISAQADSGPAAALLANATAEMYVARANGDYSLGVQQALASARSQLHAVELALAANPGASTVTKSRKSAAGAGGSKTSDILEEATLKTKISQLESQLGIISVRQVGVANGRAAAPLKSDPKENAIFGFVLGMFLACVAAYVLNRFDRRLRTLGAIEAVFDAHVLAALPSAKQPIGMSNGRLTPSRALNEPLRRLHTTIALVGGMGNGNKATRPRSLVFLSADAGDGKSTVAAGLALVQRDFGEQVSLIEADFRRPVLGRMLRTRQMEGLAEVLTGSLRLADAMQRVDPDVDMAPEPRPDGAAAGVATVVNATTNGTLSLLVGEPAVHNPPALLASDEMTAVLRWSRDEFDHVLIDAPPPLMVSDILPVLSAVDGIVLVARAGHTREASARRLMQLLARTPSAPVLGVVANDVSRGDVTRYGYSYGYGYGYAYGYGSRRRGLLGRLLAR